MTRTKPYLITVQGAFPRLTCFGDTFVNSKGVSISYFNYHYDGFDERRLILFCPGMGPGHTAYLSEIEMLCRARNRVLTILRAGKAHYFSGGMKGGFHIENTIMPSISVHGMI